MLLAVETSARLQSSRSRKVTDFFTQEWRGGILDGVS